MTNTTLDIFQERVKIDLEKMIMSMYTGQNTKE